MKTRTMYIANSQDRGVFHEVGDLRKRLSVNRAVARIWSTTADLRLAALPPCAAQRSSTTFLSSSFFMLTLAIFLISPTPLVSSQETVPPLNAPAAAQWDATRAELTLDYHGVRILSAKVTAEDADGGKVAVNMAPAVNAADEKVQQALNFTPAEPREGIRIVLSGTVTGSGEAFPAETDSEAQQRFPYVRNSVGLSRNLRNNAVYDRRWDWALIGPADGSTRITPDINDEDNRTFVIECRGEHLQIVFRPRFYQRHHGYQHFEPWTYKVWKGSLSGYCTWWAYRHSFSQETLDAMLELFVEKHLPDFGYDYMQFDDTYQQGNGSCPENWLNWNSKFPGGWEYSIKAIRDAGMKPGY